MVQNVPQQQQDHHQSRLRRLMSAPTIEAIAQTVEEVGKEHASSTGQTEDRSQRSSCDRDPGHQPDA
jgi:hypothetical protein